MTELRFISREPIHWDGSSGKSFVPRQPMVLNTSFELLPKKKV
jgi:hypothetical protein